MAVFAKDDALDYVRLRTAILPGSSLRMDAPYRRAHLPLVAPDHPDVIPQDAGRGYRLGRHDTVWSLVVPVPQAVLAGSAGLVEIDAALRGSPAATKIAWPMIEARRDLLHATICGGLGQGAQPPSCAGLQALSALPAFAVRLRGLFSGNINIGRLYLKLYPEIQAGTNAIHRLQACLGRPPTSLYLVGLYNLVDHLDVQETAHLAALLERFGQVNLADFMVEELWLLGSRDDLALDSEVAHRIRLS
jgi:hypothetical protein